MTEPELPKARLERILTRVQRQIRFVQNLYFADPKKLSSIYWPRSMRDFLKAILTYVLEKRPDILDNREDVEVLQSELCKSTSTYIHVKYRRVAFQLLNAIVVLQIKPTIPFLYPSLPSGVAAGPFQWPTDITCADDLRAYFGSDSLRSDVLEYLFDFLVQKARMRSFQISFTPSNSKPISILCPSSQVHELQLLLIEESHQLEKIVVDEVPFNLIEVQASDDCHFVLKEDGFHTSGSPLLSGTLGAIFSINGPAAPSILGVTCAHVTSSSWPLNVKLNVEDSNPVVFENLVINTSELDAAIVYLKSTDDDRHISLWNILTLADPTLHDIVPVVGEEIYKIGAKTGLTIGRLAALSTSFTYDVSGREHQSKKYTNVVEVSWGVGENFAMPGDSGALYCIRRGNIFYPIAIHRVSDGKRSFGSKYATIMDFFSDSLPDMSFRNPPGSA